MQPDKLTIVIPAFNEEAGLKNTLERLFTIEQGLIDNHKITPDSDILVVDDGSKDRTWEVISDYAQTQPRLAALRFSRNFGHQNALIAGLTAAIKTAAVTVTIDADLQDDPDAIVDMINQYHAGDDIVYGVRASRKTDSWFKRNSALAYYGLLRKLGVDLVPNHADFRLMSKRAVTTFLEYHERNMFIRGLIPKLGFHTGKVYYDRTPRLAGESKYPLSKMLTFAWNGVTSLTVAPVRAVLYIGLLVSGLGLLMLLYTLGEWAIGRTVSGWSSLIISIWFLGGVQLFSLGLIGEYVGKMMLEVKHRPRYTVAETLTNGQQHEVEGGAHEQA